MNPKRCLEDSQAPSGCFQFAESKASLRDRNVSISSPHATLLLPSRLLNCADIKQANKASVGKKQPLILSAQALPEHRLICPKNLKSESSTAKILQHSEPLCQSYKNNSEKSPKLPPKKAPPTTSVGQCSPNTVLLNIINPAKPAKPKTASVL